MLEKNDFIVLKDMVASVVDERMERLENKMDERVERLESKMDERLECLENKMNNRLEQSENFVLEEIDRTRDILERRIGRVEKSVDEIKQYYQAVKLENENLAMVQKQVNDLTKRVEKLEEKLA